MVLAIDGRLSVARKALQFAVGFPDNLLRQSPEFLFASAIVARAEADLPRAAAMIDTAVLGYTPSPTEWLAAKAAIYLDQDRLEELEQHMEEWLRRGRRELGPKERAVLGAVLLDVKIARGKPEEATTLFRVIPPEVRPEWGTESLVSESEIAILQKRPRRAVQLANQALRRAAHQFGSNSYEQARLQLARAYQAAGEPKQAASLLDALQVQATREGDKALELKLRLVRWEDPPTGRSRHRDELKQLEADTTRAGLLRIAREAREAAAR